MRVILITTKLNLGTAGGSVVDLHLKARSLVERGHDVTVVTAFSENNRPAHDLPYRLVEEFMPSHKLLTIQKSGFEILKKHEKNTDVFYIDGHVFCYGAGWYRLMGGKVPVVGFFNIKLTGWYDAHAQLHSLPFLKKTKALARSFAERWLGIWIANRLDAFIFTTPTVADLYRRHGFTMSKANIVLDFSEGSAESFTPASRPHSPNSIKLFASGRMIKEKGFDLLVRAFAKLGHSDVSLTISGGGPEAEAVKKLAEELGVANRITFPGWVEREELYRLMDISDVFILPRWIIEYSSVLLMEAMMRGLPVIVPKGGGLEWIAGNGGITFVDGDVEDLSRAMHILIEDRLTLKSLSQHAFSRAEDFRYEKLGDTFLAILEKTRLSKNA